jgi:ABC-type dipeptide/oligopeptide/nickel transport system permease subunit
MPVSDVRPGRPAESAALAGAAEATAPIAAPAGRAGVLRRLLRDRPAQVALAILALLVLCALLGSVVFGSPTDIDPLNQLTEPTGAHPFGTDELGRDLLARTAVAGRISLRVGALATLLAMLVGGLWGVGAAGARGILDDVLMRVADAAMAIPVILFALIFIAALGTDTVTLTLVTGLLMTPLTARVVRAAVLGELANDYVLALRAVGAPTWRIMLVEVLPNTTPALLAQTSLNLATALIVEASLSFVGLGVQPPDASWGTLLKDGYDQLFNTIWYPLFPALAIVLTVGALNVVADRAQAILDRTDA